MNVRESVRLAAVLLFCLMFAAAPHVSAQDTLRVATYNIKFLSTDAPDARLQRLRDVIGLLDADVIGLQEIGDRDALRLIFPASDWQVIIDDDSGDDQDLAVVVRSPWQVVGSPTTMDIDADDEHFLFSDAPDMFFPNRRDLLAIPVEHAQNGHRFTLLVHHGKSRSGGRANTEWRRVAAAALIAQKLETDFQETNFVLLGDFNDNPDDQAVNVLERGSYTAVADEENDDGAFLVNLTEDLVASDHVSHSLNESSIDNGRVMTVVAGSRELNAAQRCTNQTGNFPDILFDQILVPHTMYDRYIPGSCRVFDQTVAVVGNNTTRASDHLPVSADFVFGGVVTHVVPEGVYIVGLLPNPDGPDRDHEEVYLFNATSSAISLDGWQLRDRLDRTFDLAGSIDTGDTLRVLLAPQTMPLTNSGDNIRLVNPDGVSVSDVTYAESHVGSGTVVHFNLDGEPQ